MRYRGVPVGRVSNLRVEPGGRTIEIDFELFPDRLNTDRRERHRTSRNWPTAGVFPSGCAPRWWATP